MLYEGNHEVPEHIDCSEVLRIGGRVKGGIVAESELQEDEEIRVSIRSSRYPSVEVFTLRNLRPADYQLVLVAIPRKRGNG